MTTINFTDVGNASRFVADHGHDLRHVAEWDRWLVWSDGRWQPDRAGHVIELAKKTARTILAEAANVDDKDKRRDMTRWALATENVNRLKAMVELAKSAPGIPVRADDLDADPWALNCANGTLDLRTGDLYPPDRGQLLTRTTGIRYDPDAPFDRWSKFLRQIVPDAPEHGADPRIAAGVREFLQRMAGYALTGDVSEQKLFIPYGVGANGKSTFTEALAYCMGDYAITAPPDLLVIRSNDPHPTGIADLHGARLVLASETGQGRRLDESLVKRLTSVERVKARRMHKDFFEFEPTHKVMLSTNHQPIVDGTDHGIWRRLVLIPFTVVIPDEQRDRQLGERLQGEAEGILAWAVRGCLRWQENGLTEPIAVTEATAGYRADMDRVGEFIADECLISPEMKATAADLWSAWRRWCERNGEDVGSQHRFGSALTERGLNRRRSGRHWWHGIGLVGPSGPMDRPNDKTAYMRTHVRRFQDQGPNGSKGPDFTLDLHPGGER